MLALALAVLTAPGAEVAAAAERGEIAPLRIGLQKAGVPVLLNTALTDLYVSDGAVRGVYVRDTTGPESAEPQLIKARRGVILGSGGFDIRALLAWVAVGIPLACGIWITLQKALVLFT